MYFVAKLEVETLITQSHNTFLLLPVIAITIVVKGQKALLASYSSRAVSRNVPMLIYSFIPCNRVRPKW